MLISEIIPTKRLRIGFHVAIKQNDGKILCHIINILELLIKIIV